MSVGPLAAQGRGALPSRVAEAVRPLPGRVSGTVVDQATVDPLPGARVFLLLPDSGRVVAYTETDSLGAYTLPQVAPGSYRLRVQSIGYLPTTGPVDLNGDVTLTAALVPKAVDLEPVTVTVKRSESRVLRDFNRRKARGIGSFVTREDMAKGHVFQVTDVLSRTTRLHVVRNRYGDGMLFMRGRCRPQIYIDGVAVANSMSLDLALRPEDVEGVEVYSNAEVPAEYAHAACGAILVWTRVPQRVQGQGSWWKRLTLVGAVGGLIYLLH
ncbi:MAG: carboxypeptidase regulatory-like domain-containing protein [Gemmatimonadota bacterium]